jgi:recombination protein RecT
MSSSTAVVLVRDRQGLASLMEGMKQSMADVLPRHITPERVMKMALVAASRQPKLFECTKESICKAVITASELGLDCSGTLGSGYLVPFYNNNIRASEAQFIPGYRGLIDLARRSGQIKRIEAHVVFKQDEFDVSFGLDPKLDHKPYIGADRKESQADIRAVYAVAELSDGSKQCEVMTASQVEAIRRRSKAANNGPWVTDYAEMARKTVVKRLCKYLPLSPELEKAIQLDNEVDGVFVDVTPTAPSAEPPAGKKTDRLAKRLTTQPAEEPATPEPEQPTPPEPDPSEPPIEPPHELAESEPQQPMEDEPPVLMEMTIQQVKGAEPGTHCTLTANLKTVTPRKTKSGRDTTAVELSHGPYDLKATAWGTPPAWAVKGARVLISDLEVAPGDKGNFYNIKAWEPVSA